MGLQQRQRRVWLDYWLVLAQWKHQGRGVVGIHGWWSNYYAWSCDRVSQVYNRCTRVEVLWIKAVLLIQMFNVQSSVDFSNSQADTNFTVSQATPLFGVSSENCVFQQVQEKNARCHPLIPDLPLSRSMRVGALDYCHPASPLQGVLISSGEGDPSRVLRSVLVGVWA